MKRTAFTLVELMAVIAIIGLLMAVLLPSMSSVYAVTRANVCKMNLSHIGNAFSIASGAASVKDPGRGGVGKVTAAFPDAMAWPSIPRNAVPDPEIYQCPEEPVDIGNSKYKRVTDSYAKIEYVCPYGKFPLSTGEGLHEFYLVRRGRNDEMGSYTDFMLQDDYGNGQLEMMNFHGWFDTDGFIRVYDKGIVHVFDHVPDTPEFSGASGPGYPNRVNTCGNQNDLLYMGKPAFGGDAALRNHRGQSLELKDWHQDFSSYGMSSYAWQYAYGSKCLVVVDYKQLIVELDTPLESEKLLAEAARHLGRVNYLRGDGSVKTDSPVKISPRVNLPIWRP